VNKKTLPSFKIINTTLATPPLYGLGG